MTCHSHKRRGVLAPDPEMWAALDHGKQLSAILGDFYTQVYADSRLSPFFDGVTQQRAIEKQYSFLRSIFTGERCYFGEHPKNAHHWMVITDQLFDYREQLMERCLRAAALPEHLIRRWRAVEEVFRRSIVKARPKPKRIAGMALPVEGYGETRLDVATLCDGCAGEIHEEMLVSYHRRTGKVYCASCARHLHGGKRSAVSSRDANITEEKSTVSNVMYKEIE